MTLTIDGFGFTQTSCMTTCTLGLCNIILVSRSQTMTTSYCTEYWRSLEVTGDYWRLLESTRDCKRLLEITGVSVPHFSTLAVHSHTLTFSPADVLLLSKTATHPPANVYHWLYTTSCDWESLLTNGFIPRLAWE